MKKVMLNSSCTTTTISLSNSATPSSPRIRVLATIDPPYATDCLDVYPHDKECTHPGFEIEYNHTVISGMMGRAIQWIKVGNYTIMEQYLAEGKGDIFGISYTLDLGKSFKGFHKKTQGVTDSVTLSWGSF